MNKYKVVVAKRSPKNEGTTYQAIIVEAERSDVAIQGTNPVLIFITGVDKEAEGVAAFNDWEYFIKLGDEDGQ